MKRIITTAFYLSLSVVTVSFLGSCGNSNKGTHTHADGTTHSNDHEEDAHKHEGEEAHTHADGSTHEHDEHDHASNFITELKTNPAALQAGQSATLSLTPKLKDNATADVPLDLSHGKKMHLIVVDDALTTFAHLHPDYQASGSYDAKTTFATGGTYFIFADYKPSEGSEVQNKHSLNVGGTPAKNAAATAQRLTWTSNGITLTLKPDYNKVETGAEQHIDSILTQNGKPVKVESLENYLGNKAHVVMIGLADKDYAHVHPETEAGNFHFHAEFHHEGLYRAWVQFMLNGKLQVADFVINVTKGAAKAEAKDHKHD
jgi:hypothetical protein